MKWTIEYKKNNGWDVKAETYNECTILGSYCGNSGLLVSVPERKSDKDTGIRRMSYNGIVTMTLTNR